MRATLACTAVGRARRGRATATASPHRERPGPLQLAALHDGEDLVVAHEAEDRLGLAVEVVDLDVAALAADALGQADEQAVAVGVDLRQIGEVEDDLLP